MPKKNELSPISILAKRYRCHPRTIRNWRDAGAPLDDRKAMTVWLSRRRTVPLGVVSTAMRHARLWKLTLECERLEFRLAIAKGAYVRLSEVQADMLRIGSAVRTALDRFVDEIPTWEALPAAKMHLRAVAILDSVCADLHASHAGLYPSAQASNASICAPAPVLRDEDRPSYGSLKPRECAQRTPAKTTPSLA